MKRTTTLAFITYFALMIACVNAQTPASNPRLVADINPGPESSSGRYSIEGAATFGSALFFRAYTPQDGSEMWKTEFSSLATSQITSFSPGADGFFTYVFNGNGILFLNARGDVSEGNELWKSDGSVQGTTLVKNILPGSDGSRPQYFASLNGTTYFTAGNLIKIFRPPGNVQYPITCTQLFRTDGTANGTYMVKDFSTSPYGSGIWNTTTIGGLLYFTVHQGKYPPGWGGQSNGLGRSDGTANGSILLTRISQLGEFTSPGTGRGYFKALNSTLFFSLTNSLFGSEPWITDGSIQGTSALKDIKAGSSGSDPAFFVPLGEYMYFTADDGTHGVELWRSDGTSNGTVMIADINPGSTSSYPRWLTPVDGMLYFIASGGSEGRQLWRYNPSALTALERVAVINPTGDCEPELNTTHPEWLSGNYNPGYPDGMLATAYIDDVHLVYFVANDGVHGFEIWQSDGTAQGTRLVKDVCVNASATSIFNLTNYLDKIWFTQDDGIHGIEPWILDPTQPLDYMYNRPPVVSLSANPTQGTDPLLVQFSASANDPDGSIVLYEWDFGDNTNTSGAAVVAPSHTYHTTGVYTARVTVTDNGNAKASVTAVITVTSANAYVYVSSQTVTRVSKLGGKWAGRDVVIIRDHNYAPEAGATVTVSYNGPNAGTLSGSTNASGEVAFETPTVKNPVGSWCFTVTNVQASGKPFNSSTGEVIKCEGIPKEAPALPFTSILDQNYPNPFSTSTTIRFTLSDECCVRLSVYDLLGRELYTILDARLPEGRHEVYFDARKLPTGTYYYHLDALGIRQTRVMVIQQ